MSFDDKTATQLLCIPSVIFGILSLLSNVYIIISIKILKKTKENNELQTTNNTNDSTVVDIIYWMTVSDISSCIWVIINYGPQSVYPLSFNWPNTVCYLLGIWCQFWLLNGVSWHFLIAFCLFILLIKNSSNVGLWNPKYTPILPIYIFSSIITIIPLINKKYGDYKDARYYVYSFHNYKSIYLILYVIILVIFMNKNVG